MQLDMDGFRSSLEMMLVHELRMWRDRLSTETMRAFHLGCYPWHGYLEPSFLTIEEPTLPPPDGDRYRNVAHWRWYHFTSTFTSGRWPQAIEICQWMRSHWEQSGDTADTAESFFAAAVLAVTSPAVVTELKTFRRTQDFEVAVFDPDHPGRGNLCATTRVDWS